MNKTLYYRLRNFLFPALASRRRRIALKRLVRKQLCAHPRGYLYDQATCNTYVGYCPDCNEDYFIEESP